ncbi:hypothetical protein Tco_1051242 [Tanacetum coccineum]
MQVDFPAYILEILTKLNEFTNALSALTSKIEKLEGFKLELLVDLHSLPSHLSNVTSQVVNLKVLDVITNIMNKVTASLERFADDISSASQRAESSGVPSACQAATPFMQSPFTSRPEKTIPRTEGEQSKDKGKKAMSQEDIVVAKEEDSNSDSDDDSRPSEFRNACSNRIGAGWKIIYIQMRERIDDFNSMGDQLELYLTRPLEEQDPTIRLNHLAKRKRKNLDELQDYFKSTKR